MGDETTAYLIGLDDAQEEIARLTRERDEARAEADCAQRNRETLAAALERASERAKKAEAEVERLGAGLQRLREDFGPAGRVADRCTDLLRGPGQI